LQIYKDAQMALKWILFDVGGVLVDLDVPAWLGLLAQESGRPLEEIKQIVNGPDDNPVRQVLRLGGIGVCSEEDFLETHCRLLGGGITPASVRAAYMAMLKGENQEMLQLVPGLKATLRLLCFSNTNAMHWEYMRAHYKIFDFMEYSLASHIVKLRKPDPAVYQYICTKLNISAHECLLVDDTLENVQAAQDFGMQALHFHAPQDLHFLLGRS
jgi:putative hydrolase of the HAD superfamily